MHPNIYKYLSKQVSDDPKSIDRLITTTYLEYHKLAVLNNDLIKDHKIDLSIDSSEKSIFYDFLSLIQTTSDSFNFEDLIELFEFVISPSDKVVNGAIYTPLYIRSYIISTVLDRTTVSLSELTAYDPSCGCGAFLLTLSRELKGKTNKNYQSIYKDQIFGVDITEYSITRAKILLSLQAIESGEDFNFIFNFKVENSLTFNPQDAFPLISNRNGFDAVIGNPPYVTSRNMDLITLKLSLLWDVSKSGHPDLYIPFFELGIKQLSDKGILGYITVNSFIKSINGRALRQYFETNNLNLQIINFGGEQIFEERNTYTCICFVDRKISHVGYIRSTSNQLNKITPELFRMYQYDELNHLDGWNLVNTTVLAHFIKKIELTGLPFESKFKTKNGIATLKNDSYKFIPINSYDMYYYLKNEFGIYPIEKNICRDIVNANKLKTENDLLRIREKIIFPYQWDNGQLKIISEVKMQISYPATYCYLQSQKEILAKRDKGNKTYATWYAYGRRQSMDNYPFKLFFPHICDRPTFVICEERDLLFYNGIAAVSDTLEPLLVLQKLLESNLFYHYIKNTTKDYSSGYISMSRNYLKKFGIPDLTPTQIKKLLECKDPNSFLESIYDVGAFIRELE